MAGLTEIRGFQGELLGPRTPATTRRDASGTPPSTSDRPDRAVLRDDADALLDTDYVDSARIVAVEFVNMVAAVDRLVEAARVLAYLDTTEGFGVLARYTLVADAVASIAAAPQVTDDGGPDLDAREAMVYMRDVLDELAEDEESAQRPSRS